MTNILVRTYGDTRAELQRNRKFALANYNSDVELVMQDCDTERIAAHILGDNAHAADYVVVLARSTVRAIRGDDFLREFGGKRELEALAWLAAATIEPFYAVERKGDDTQLLGRDLEPLASAASNGGEHSPVSDILRAWGDKPTYFNGRWIQYVKQHDAWRA